MVADCVEPIPVAGLTPLTTIDFPGRLAMVVFTQGCPWRCPYCHNAGMRSFGLGPKFAWATVLELLRERRGFLDGMAFSGGEPLSHTGLGAAMRAVHAEGFAVGLHTAGAFPERLAAVLPHLDWVGLDIKGPLDHRYERVSGVPESAGKVRACLKLLLASGIEFELRTTVAPGLLEPRDLDDLRAHLRDLGAPEPVMRAARPVLP